jgi:hypothetical protein
MATSPCANAEHIDVSNAADTRRMRENRNATIRSHTTRYAKPPFTGRQFRYTARTRSAAG